MEMGDRVDLDHQPMEIWFKGEGRGRKSRRPIGRRQLRGGVG